jgi:hypothetical protein
METIISLLQTIGKISLIVLAFSLCVFLFFSIKDKKPNSSLIGMITVVLLGAMMRWYAPHLLALKTSLDPSYLPYILFTWYIGFTLIHVIGIYVIYKTHITFTIPYSFISKMVVLGYFIQGQTQLIRYSERLLFGLESQHLKAAYQALIPAVNIGMASLALCFVTAMAISRYRVQQGKGGLTWIL